MQMFTDIHVNAKKRTGYLWGEEQGLDDKFLFLYLKNLYSLNFLKLSFCKENKQLHRTGKSIKSPIKVGIKDVNLFFQKAEEQENHM